MNIKSVDVSSLGTNLGYSVEGNPATRPMGRDMAVVGYAAAPRSASAGEAVAGGVGLQSRLAQKDPKSLIEKCTKLMAFLTKFFPGIEASVALQYKAANCAMEKFDPATTSDQDFIDILFSLSDILSYHHSMSYVILHKEENGLEYPVPPFICSTFLELFQLMEQSPNLEPAKIRDVRAHLAHFNVHGFNYITKAWKGKVSPKLEQMLEVTKKEFTRAKCVNDIKYIVANTPARWSRYEVTEETAARTDKALKAVEVGDFDPTKVSAETFLDIVFVATERYNRVVGTVVEGVDYDIPVFFVEIIGQMRQSPNVTKETLTEAFDFLDMIYFWNQGIRSSKSESYPNFNVLYKSLEQYRYVEIGKPMLWADM